MRQRDGVVGSRLGKGQMLLHLPGETDLAQKGNETGQTTEGRDRLGRFVQNQLGLAKKRGNFGAGRFVQVGSGCLSINPYAHNPLLKTTLFSISEFGLKAIRIFYEGFKGIFCDFRTPTGRVQSWMERTLRATTPLFQSNLPGALRSFPILW